MVAHATACLRERRFASREGNPCVRILVTDDEPMIRELVRVTLARESRFEVSLASDGAMAVSMVRELRPQLVLLDVRMPGVDGIEACRQIRAESSIEQPTIIMLTAMGQDSDVKLGMDAGADEYFIKPFSPITLLDKVYEVAGIAA